ncbi:DUF4178 domain-containing protein [Novosphingobium sp. FSY-8]|uniref:DUF4178 domain-containing protein n=1 Tax=Novosphingobium ovatum TaxID=1908523 RepID=A0ABW9XDX5_9SPHN|nr:DUF4178 domain-containing protein [Novosphingobium ovatum]NBC36748.1 DUF4178 domain-containing protein [Novosphingobium ovatum]
MVNASSAKPRSVTCPQCGGGIDIRAAGVTISVGCQYCGALLDVANPDVALITAWHQEVAKLKLPLGSRGVIDGVTWEVIGWVERSAQGWTWAEYLLFNPYAGYRWLVRSGDEWQFGRMLTERPRELLNAGQVDWRGQAFTAEEGPVTITTTRVLGEFYWRVRAGEEWQAVSFSAGPQSLSREADGDEVQWTHLVPVAPQVIERFVKPVNFNASSPRHANPSAPPPQRGYSSDTSSTWANRPWRADGDHWRMFAFAVLTSLLAMIVLALAGIKGNEAVGRTQLVVDGPEVQFSAGTITVTRPRQFVTIRAATDTFVNKWVDLDYVLVNKATQQGVPASDVVEYYEGTDSDGHWTEGSHQTTTLIAEVPAGNYELMVQAQAHAWNGGGSSTTSSDTPADPWGLASAGGASAGTGEQVSLAVSASTGGFPWGLFWLVVGGVFVIPIIIILYRANNKDDE